MNKLINLANNDFPLFVKLILDIVGIGFLVWSVYLGGFDKTPLWTLFYLAAIGMIDFMIQVNKGIVWRCILDGVFLFSVLYSLFTK